MAIPSLFQRFSHKHRIEQLEEEVSKLQREMRGLQAEWADMHDRFRSMMGRISKSAALAQEREDAMMGKAAKESAANGGSGPALVDSRGGLTPRQREIQQAILKRRAGA